MGKAYEARNAVAFEESRNEMMALVQKESEERTRHLNDVTQVLNTHHRRLEMSDAAHERRLQQCKSENTVIHTETQSRLNELTLMLKRASTEQLEQHRAFEEQKEKLEHLRQSLENKQTHHEPVVLDVLEESMEKRLLGLIEHERMERCKSAASVIKCIDELSASCAQDKYRIEELSAALLNTASDIKARLNAEVKERVAADERGEGEVQSKLKMELAALQPFLDQQDQERTSQLHFMKDELIAVQERINEMVSTQNKALLGVEGLRDEVNKHKQGTHDALAQESADREGEDNNLQMGVNKLQERANFLKTELDDLAKRLWDAIEMHTHDIRIDNVADANSLDRVRVPAEQPRLVHLHPPTGTTASLVHQGSQQNVQRVTNAQASRSPVPPVLQPSQLAARVLSAASISPAIPGKVSVNSSLTPQTTAVHSPAVSVPLIDRSATEVGVPSLQKVSASVSAQ